MNKIHDNFVEINPIKLHDKSVAFLREVFNQYKEGELTSDTIVHRPIIHLYAKKDTANKHGGLDGFIDSLFFEAHIYDPVKKKI